MSNFTELMNNLKKISELPDREIQGQKKRTPDENYAELMNNLKKISELPDRKIERKDGLIMKFLKKIFN